MNRNLAVLGITVGIFVLASNMEVKSNNGCLPDPGTPQPPNSCWVGDPVCAYVPLVNGEYCDGLGVLPTDGTCTVRNTTDPVTGLIDQDCHPFDNTPAYGVDENCVTRKDHCPTSNPPECFLKPSGTFMVTVYACIAIPYYFPYSSAVKCEPSPWIAVVDVCDVP